MIVNTKELHVQGVYELIPHTFKDDRGTMSKIYHRPSFEALGLTCDFGETIVSTNYCKGTVKGFHMQTKPYAQAKVIFAAKGSFLNIVLDMREESETYGVHDTITISSEKANMIYVPEGVANCYCILEDDTIVIYNISSEYRPEFEAGVHYRSVNVAYPFEDLIISEKDRNLPMFSASPK